MCFAALVMMTSCKRKSEKIVYDASGQSIESIEFPLTNDLQRIFVFNEKGGLDQQYISNDRGKQGNFIAYNEDGLLNQMATFLNDTLHGVALTYYKNGHVRDEYVYERGIKKSLTQFNDNGSKRGEELYFEDSTFYRRIWDYDSLLNVSSLFISICSIIRIEEQNDSDSIKIDFHLPLDNEEFANKDLRLAYIIEFYENGKLVDKNMAQDLQFKNGLYSKNLFVSELIDSLMITDQISHLNQQFEACKIRIVFDDI